MKSYQSPEILLLDIKPIDVLTASNTTFDDGAGYDDQNQLDFSQIGK